jgi:hypothetical protein
MIDFISCNDKPRESNQKKKTTTDLDSYIRNRTRLIITRKVIKELRILADIDF